MSSRAILREITQVEAGTVSPRECISCGKEQTPIDIATQAVQEPGAGMHCCQSCLPIEMGWLDLDWNA